MVLLIEHEGCTKPVKRSLVANEKAALRKTISNPFLGLIWLACCKGNPPDARLKIGMKALDDRVWIKMAKYLANEASAEERQQISTLLAENKTVREMYEKLRVVYLTRDAGETVDSATAFEKLEARIKGNVPLARID